ncbi:hypothetical protein CONPUDRAFT_123058 [Coniophora puteana RWD-64-598 SS2]|uniref:CASTOR ACT domain-containing protein n=1 Tax=Coniophora puteana (strain RWD-64-598) TaxID=741705 RepID=A0A5M3MT01_CONPW|nr:uncharacterized protein CONPUDRAFT_123058 [Coniophora puteana RWD-64-598 SS2]EIW82292.1 hypothetical protein CONPUDRAFT_123058 [Coniophora puteana RWD-64-598 SS2]
MASASPNNSCQVTVSLLPVSLSLVRVPRARLPQLSHPILRQILQPNPVFLNVTCNEIELSLFAEHHMLADFEAIARRDHRQRQRSRSGSGSSRKRATTPIDEPVEISCETWNVLQIDSHSDRLDNSGARVHELSAPLAEAGISILYQSSYMSDYIFVKGSRLQEVMSLLGSAGFDLYSEDPELLTSRVVSPIVSPISTDDSAIVELALDFNPESGAVLTRTRSSADISMAGVASMLQYTKLDDDTEKTAASHSRPGSRSKSFSPGSRDVSVLSADLTCVGLSDDDVDTWGLKIVKLVAFPELIPSNYPKSALGPVPGAKTAKDALKYCHRRDSSSDSSSSSSDEEGYFSHSPSGNLSTTTLISSVTSKSCPDLPKSASITSASLKTATKHLVPSVAPLSPLEGVALSEHLDDSRSDTPKAPAGRDGSSSAGVPFFSFTRTSEGTSLTTDVTLLASLFPPSERHMVACSGGLDALDARNSLLESDESEEDDLLAQGGTLKCLQIDLRRFGLDKHGLVNRFSRVLEEHGINHMYSSTYKTANLLVSKAQAHRARALLRSC